ncbi:MAG TPA: methyltransferase domain-containing protein [Verrucomicrobiae bacterium]|nr:methyltransferase domain-containing protein [Verrucomicrobiae bacterium]
MKHILVFVRLMLTGHPKRAVRHLQSLYYMRTTGDSLRLHIGCGSRRLPGFVNIDRNSSAATDYVADAGHLPCRENSVERIENYHVIEHIPYPAVRGVLMEWFRVLIPGGTLVIECPDFDRASREYLDGNEERLYSIYGRQRFPGDAHHWGYTAARLKTLLESVGFSDMEAQPPQDYHKENEPCLRIECRKSITKP